MATAKLDCESLPDDLEADYAKAMRLTNAGDDLRLGHTQVGADHARQIDRAGHAGDEEDHPSTPVVQVVLMPPAGDHSATQARDKQFEPVDFVEQAL